MTMDADLAALFSSPQRSRDRIIGAMRPQCSLPDHGSSFFIHLSELCPVACEHCMYSSDLNRKSAKDSLSPTELEAAIDFIDDSHSVKLNITGGGEPFLKYRSILRLLERVDVPRIEIVTAGYWGKSAGRAERQLSEMDAALRRNPNQPQGLLRLSADRYHINAPRPVHLQHYGNIARAWQRLPLSFSLGFRSIQPDMDTVDKALADEIGATIEIVDDWNRRLVLSDGRAIPITFNVFRLSGKAAQLHDDLLDGTLTIRDYYAPFESGPNRLTLATAVNDAIRGTYTADAGAAITMNSDGTIWIFAGTAPDRRMTFQGLDFRTAMIRFFADPITHLLASEGVWALADLVSRLDPPAHIAALAKNDVACLVEDLLAPDDVRLAVTLLAARWMITTGRGQIVGERGIGGAVTGSGDLLNACAAHLRTRSR
jgi:hypothetical protein